MTHAKGSGRIGFAGRMWVGVVLLLWMGSLFPGCGDDVSPPELTGRARLPADTFVAGPTSGHFIEPANGRTPPFQDRQPVQGFSALIRNDDGSYLTLPDNGFGTQENSRDYILRVYELRPDLATAKGGTGDIAVHALFILRDPNRKIPFPIVADGDTYPDSDIPVPRSIREGRLLTGADFDVESLRRVPDGSFYIGDEFGPFLIHTDATGVVLEAPIPLPGVRSPQNPFLGDGTPNLPKSGGFEGMALSADGTRLYPMLEKPLEGEVGWVGLYVFDLQENAYTHADPLDPPYRYPLDPRAMAVPEITALSEHEFLVIERDGGQGPTATHKKVYRVDLRRVDADGLLEKREVIDLLDVADPDDLSGDGSGQFSFPYETTEALAVIDAGTVVFVNDNNYPFGRAYPDTGEPDATELIRIRLVP